MTGFDPALVEKVARALDEALRPYGHVLPCPHSEVARAVLSAVWDDIRAEGAREVADLVERRHYRYPGPLSEVPEVIEVREAVARIGGGEIHTFVPGGPKNEKGQLDPRPSCTCGEVMEVGIKTSPSGWFKLHAIKVSEET